MRVKWLPATLVCTASMAMAAMPVTAAKTTIQIWDWTKERMEVVKPKAAEYMKLHPNIEVKLSLVDWTNYPNKVLASVVGGTPPEIIMFHNSWTGHLLKILAPYPPELFPSGRMADEYFQFNSAVRMNDGKFYFFPDGLLSGTIFTNTRLWSQAGLQATPKSWDEFRLAAKKLTRIDGSGKMVQAGASFSLQYLFDDLNYQMGGGLYNDKHTGLDLFSVEGRKAMELLGQMTFNDRIRATPKDGSLPYDAGKAGMLYTWTWYKSNLLRIPSSKLQWSAFPLPTPSGSDTAIRGRNNYESGYAVPKNLKAGKRVEAFKFLKWLYSDDDYYLRLNDVMGRLPGKRALWARPELSKDLIQGAMLRTIPYTVFPGERPSWIDEILNRMEQDMNSQKRSPIEALKKAQDDADKQWRIQPPKWIVEKRLTANNK